VAVVLNSISKGIGSLNMDTTGHIASVLRQAASSSCFLPFADTFTVIFTRVNFAESAGFSASATASSSLSSIWLFLQTSAKMVMAQSAKDMIANSSAVGPVSSPPLAFGRSSAILWVLELSAKVRTFSIHLAVAFMFGSFLHLIIHVCHRKASIVYKMFIDYDAEVAGFSISWPLVRDSVARKSCPRSCQVLSCGFPGPAL